MPVAHGSAVAWRHFNLLGEYDFSAEKLRDSVGIRLPKLGAKKEAFLDLIQTHKPQRTERIIVRIATSRTCCVYSSGTSRSRRPFTI